MYSLRNCFQEAYEETRRIKQTIQDLKFLIANLDFQIQSLEDSLDNEEMTEHEESVLEQRLYTTLQTRKRAIQCLERFGIRYEN